MLEEVKENIDECLSFCPIENRLQCLRFLKASKDGDQNMTLQFASNKLYNKSGAKIEHSEQNGFEWTKYGFTGQIQPCYRNYFQSLFHDQLTVSVFTTTSVYEQLSASSYICTAIMDCLLFTFGMKT